MNALLVAKRDMAGHLNGYSGYIIIAAALFVEGLLFVAYSYFAGASYSHEILEKFFEFTSGFVMIVAVLITMRSLAEERANGTEVLLQTSPISDGSVVFGKYLAAMGMLGIMVALTAHMPAMIFVNGKVALGHILCGYLGLMSLGSAAASIGIFGSSLFRSQVAAAIVSGVLVVTILTAWILSQVTDPPFSDVLAYGALYDKHFVPFMEGRLITSALVYYASISFAFLVLATHVQAGRRWE